MKKNWKIFKLCFKCGLQKRMMLGMAIAFFIFGILFEVLQMTEISRMIDECLETGVMDIALDFDISGLYLMLVAMYIGQVIISVDVSKLVQSSPYKKKIQTDIPVFSMAFIMFVMMSFLLAMRVIEGLIFDFEPLYTMLIRDFIVIGILGGMVLIYASLIYKYYFFSLVLVFVTVFPLIFYGSRVVGKIEFLNSWISVAAGYFFLILGYILSSLVARLVYKKDIEGIVFRNSLSRVER